MYYSQQLLTSSPIRHLSQWSKGWILSLTMGSSNRLKSTKKQKKNYTGIAHLGASSCFCSFNFKLSHFYSHIVFDKYKTFVLLLCYGNLQLKYCCILCIYSFCSLKNEINHMNSIQNCQNFIPNSVQEGSFRIYIWSVRPKAKTKSENNEKL